MDTLKVEKPHSDVSANASSAAVLPSGWVVTSEVQLGHLAWLQEFSNSDHKKRGCTTLFLHFHVGMFYKHERMKFHTSPGRLGTDPYKGARLQMGEVSGQRFVSGER